MALTDEVINLDRLQCEGNKPIETIAKRANEIGLKGCTIDKIRIVGLFGKGVRVTLTYDDQPPHKIKPAYGN